MNLSKVEIKLILEDILNSLEAKDAFSEQFDALSKHLLIPRYGLDIIRFEGKVSQEDSALSYYSPWLAYSNESFRRSPRKTSITEQIDRAIFGRKNHLSQITDALIAKLKQETVLFAGRTHDEIAYDRLKELQEIYDSRLIADFGLYLAESMQEFDYRMFCRGKSMDRAAARKLIENHSQAFLDWYSRKRYYDITSALDKMSGGELDFDFRLTELLSQSRKGENEKVALLEISLENRSGVSFYLKPYSELEKEIAMVPELKNLEAGSTKVSVPYFLAKTELKGRPYSVWANVGRRNLEEEFQEFRDREINRKVTAFAWAGGLLTVGGMVGSALYQAINSISGGPVLDEINGLWKYPVMLSPIVAAGAYAAVYFSKFSREFVKDMNKGLQNAVRHVHDEIIAKIDPGTIKSYATDSEIKKQLSESFGIIKSGSIKEILSKIESNYSPISGLIECRGEIKPMPYLDMKTQNLIWGNPSTLERHIWLIDNDLSYVMQHPILDAAKYVERPVEWVFELGLFGRLPGLDAYPEAMALEYGRPASGIGLRRALVNGRLLNEEEEMSERSIFRDKYSASSPEENNLSENSYHAAAVHISLMNIVKTQRNSPYHPNLGNIQLYSAYDVLYHLHELSMSDQAKGNAEMNRLFDAAKDLVKHYYEPMERKYRLIMEDAAP